MDTGIFHRATEILRRIYGPQARFREGQYEAIEAVLSHRRTLVVQKTGWGKSLVYFISAKLSKGLTVVISPLLVLMDNQQAYARKIGLRCLTLNSRVKGAERGQMLAQLLNGRCDVLFTTPETLYSKDLQSILPNLDIGMFVVDECHCISDWGHSFRLEYGRLNRVIANLPSGVSVLGTTATANDRVIDDLQKQFGGDVYVLRGPLSRPSLHIQVLKQESQAERYAWILKNINKLPGSGIIYCLTQRDCRRLSDFLDEHGISARPYYSSTELEKVGENGLSPNEETEQLFSANRIKAIVATVKLGMGYDKPDIGFVIHFQCPSSLVAYYQQIGRAGRREGMNAYCFMMVGKEDKTIQEYFINTAFPTAEEEEKVIEALEEHAASGLKIKELERYCNLNSKALNRSVMFLVNHDIIYYDSGKYYRSANPYRFQGDHYEEVRQTKREEIRELQRFIDTTDCYSKFVVHALNDYTGEDCGKCANCVGGDILNDIEAATTEEINAVQERFNRLYIEILPRKRWPEIDSRFDMSTVIGVPNEVGMALCKYGDAGYGEMVAHDKYHADAFRDELVEQAAVALRTQIGRRGYQAITNIPSSRNNKVADFARRLAAKMGYAYMDLLEASGQGQQQKKMMNGVYQCRNAKAKIKMKPGARVPKKIILVDDMVDSKWTLTVAGRLLTLHGCESVFPFCLADSSQNEVE